MADGLNFFQQRKRKSKKSSGLNFTGSALPQGSAEILNDYERKPVGLFKVLDLLNRGQYAVTNPLRRATDPHRTYSLKEYGKSILKGLAGKERSDTTDILANFGWKPRSIQGKIARGAVGIVGDTLLDPLTYIPFGQLTAAGKLAKAGTGIKIGDKVLDLAKKADLDTALDLVQTGMKKTGLHTDDAIKSVVDSFKGIQQSNSARAMKSALDKAQIESSVLELAPTWSKQYKAGQRSLLQLELPRLFGGASTTFKPLNIIDTGKRWVEHVKPKTATEGTKLIRHGGKLGDRIEQGVFDIATKLNRKLQAGRMLMNKEVMSRLPDLTREQMKASKAGNLMKFGNELYDVGGKRGRDTLSHDVIESVRNLMGDASEADKSEFIEKIVKPVFSTDTKGQREGLARLLSDRVTAAGFDAGKTLEVADLKGLRSKKLAQKFGDSKLWRAAGRSANLASQGFNVIATPLKSIRRVAEGSSRMAGNEAAEKVAKNLGPDGENLTKGVGEFKDIVGGKEKTFTTNDDILSRIEVMEGITHPAAWTDLSVKASHRGGWDKLTLEDIADSIDYITSGHQKNVQKGFAARANRFIDRINAGKDEANQFAKAVEGIDPETAARMKRTIARWGMPEDIVKVGQAVRDHQRAVRKMGGITGEGMLNRVIYEGFGYTPHVLDAEEVVKTGGTTTAKDMSRMKHHGQTIFEAVHGVRTPTSVQHLMENADKMVKFDTKGKSVLGSDLLGGDYAAGMKEADAVTQKYYKAVREAQKAREKYEDTVRWYRETYGDEARRNLGARLDREAMGRMQGKMENLTAAQKKFQEAQEKLAQAQQNYKSALDRVAETKKGLDDMRESLKGNRATADRKQAEALANQRAASEARFNEKLSSMEKEAEELRRRAEENLKNHGWDGNPNSPTFKTALDDIKRSAIRDNFYADARRVNELQEEIGRLNSLLSMPAEELEKEYWKASSELSRFYEKYGWDGLPATEGEFFTKLHENGELDAYNSIVDRHNDVFHALRLKENPAKIEELSRKMEETYKVQNVRKLDAQSRRVGRAERDAGLMGQRIGRAEEALGKKQAKVGEAQEAAMRTADAAAQRSADIMGAFDTEAKTAGDSLRSAADFVRHMEEEGPRLEKVYDEMVAKLAKDLEQVSPVNFSPELQANLMQKLQAAQKKMQTRITLDGVAKYGTKIGPDGVLPYGHVKASSVVSEEMVQELMRSYRDADGLLRALDSVSIPHQWVTPIREMVRLGSTPLGLFGKVYDWSLTILKPFMLSHPATQMRNFFSSFFMAFAGGDFADLSKRGNWMRCAKFFGSNMKAGGDELVDIMGKQYTVRQLWDILGQNGGHNMDMVVRELLDKPPEEWYNKTGRFLKKATDTINKPVNVAAEWTENTFRLNHFINQLQQGRTVDQAIESIAMHFYDYGDLSKFEKEALRRIFPFYTFWRKNLGANMRYFVTNMGYLNLPMKAAREINAMTEGEEGTFPMEWLDNERQQWLANQGAFFVPWNKRLATMQGILPQADVGQLLSPKELLQTTIGNITPVIKSPYEAITNRDTFTGREITTETRPWTPFATVPMPPRLLHLAKPFRLAFAADQLVNTLAPERARAMGANVKQYGGDTAMEKVGGAVNDILGFRSYYQDPSEVQLNKRMEAAKLIRQIDQYLERHTELSPFMRSQIQRNRDYLYDELRRTKLEGETEEGLMKVRAQKKEARGQKRKGKGLKLF